MTVLGAIDGWGASFAAAAVVRGSSPVAAHGDACRVVRVASITKLLTAWAALIAVEEGATTLDTPLGPPGSTVRHRFAPFLNGAFTRTVDAASNTPRGWGISLPASLLKVFLPYLNFNTVFDNRRVVDELGEAPRPFDQYATGLLNFARDGKFTYPYQPWPGGAQVRQVA